MAELVADCPRCGAQLITFDAVIDTPAGVTGSDHMQYEVFCVCRSCRRATIFVLEESDLARSRRKGTYPGPARPHKLARGFHVRHHISPADVATTPPPEALPLDIEGAFREATKCAAVGCFNAAGAMFRLCLNLATKNVSGGTLAARLETLCEEKQFSSELRELGSAVRLDGNEAAHDGTLDEDAVEDLQAFATRFLTQLYTEPAKVKAAKERRKKRRSKAKEKSRDNALPSMG